MVKGSAHSAGPVPDTVSVKGPYPFALKARSEVRTPGPVPRDIDVEANTWPLAAVTLAESTCLAGDPGDNPVKCTVHSPADAVLIGIDTVAPASIDVKLAPVEENSGGKYVRRRRGGLGPGAEKHLFEVEHQLEPRRYRTGAAVRSGWHRRAT